MPKFGERETQKHFLYMWKFDTTSGPSGPRNNGDVGVIHIP